MKTGETRSAMVLDLIPEWTVQRFGQCVTCNHSRDKADGAMRCARYNLRISKDWSCASFAAAPEVTSNKNRMFVERFEN